MAATFTTVGQVQQHRSACHCCVLLLAVCISRRRGALTAPVLALLADVEWRQLDLAGCGGLTAAELLALSHRMPHIQVLDVTGKAVARIVARCVVLT